jgi:hypothetical protein
LQDLAFRALEVPDVLADRYIVLFVAVVFAYARPLKTMYKPVAVKVFSITANQCSHNAADMALMKVGVRQRVVWCFLGSPLTGIELAVNDDFNWVRLNEALPHNSGPVQCRILLV